jgi:hypothetical protein
MLLLQSKAIEILYIILNLRVHLLAIFHFQMMHQFNLEFQNILMNIFVKQLSITKMKTFVQSLQNFMKQVVFNYLELFKRLLFLMEKNHGKSI